MYIKGIDFYRCMKENFSNHISLRRFLIARMIVRYTTNNLLNILFKIRYIIMQNYMVLCLYCEYFRENMNFLIGVDKWVYFVNVSMLHILILLLAVLVCFVSPTSCQK